MKTTSTPIIWAFICLIPTFLAGQSIQEQTPLLINDNSLRALQSNSMQSMTGSPLLRVSNIGSSGQDGVSIELNSLSLMNPGPSVLFDCPDPLISGSGAIRLQPSSALSSLRLTNIGSSGQDGVAIDLGEAVVPSFRPRISMRKPLVAGTQSAILFEPGEDTPYLRITNIGSSGQDGIQLTSQDDASGNSIFCTLDNDTGAIDFVRWGSAGSDSVSFRSFFDLELPGLMERISSASLDSFFDVFYDLSLGTVGTGFGQNPNNICAVRTFNPTIPSLLERISSNLPAVQSFFDVFVDLNARAHTHRVGIMGDPDFDLLRIQSYEIDTPRILERIETTIGPWTERFFDIEYDLDLGVIGTGFGNNPDNICAITKFNPMTPSVRERIQASGDDSFFDVFTDLNARSQTHKVGIMGDPDFDLLRIQSYEIDTPRILERIETTIGPWTDRFFDIEYDLDLGMIGTGFGNNPDNICAITKFNPMTPSVRERIQASGDDSFFDVFTDLSARSKTHKVGIMGDPDFDLLRIQSYELDTPRVMERIETTNPNPLWIDSYFDISYDLHTKTEKVQMQDLHVTRTFGAATSKLHEAILSGHPTANGSFSLLLDLGLEREVRRMNHLPGDPDFDLLVIRDYDRATPKLTESILSTNPLTNSYAETVNMNFMSLSYVFTDDDNDNMGHSWTYDPNGPAGTMVLASNSSSGSFVTHYDLSTKTETRSFVDGTTEVNEQATYIAPILEKKITYSGPEPPFIIHHDLLAGIQRVSRGDLMCTETFNIPSHQYQQLISFDDPTTPGSIRTMYDITQSNLLKQSTMALPGMGLQPIEVHTEYDRIAHSIREICIEPGLPSLTLERRLQTPFGPTLGIGGSITIGNGGAIRSDAGPILMAGNVVVNGDLNVTGVKMFKIDHPLDPDNKYLIHSCIESPDMMNIYNGNATTDDQGYVTINLPDYFEALNNDFRYQLTCMGQFAQAIVSEKILDNKFVIRTDKPNVEVSWQVTGIRKDPASKRDSFQAEIEKEPEMKGKRLYQQ